MFLGHYAVGLAAKKVSPRINLGYLTGAAVGLDLIWPLFVLAGWEWFSIKPGVTALNPLDFEHYPWSHSLLLVLGWSMLAFMLGRLWLKASFKDAAVLGALVLSHWLLDLIVHRPDLPLWPGGPVEGWGLWNNVMGTVFLEYGLLAAGLFCYIKIKRGGTLRVWALGSWASFIAIIYAASVWGPAPPSPHPVAVSALAQWGLVAWAGYVDRERAGP